MKRYIMSIIVIALTYVGAIAQSGGEKFIQPLNIPISLSGTYGELRPNHFHAGLDFRVGGVVGEPIHAIKSGYISRISVSVGGYGNALYINHPDGTMSVYGHMHEFPEEIAELVLDTQYSQKRFNINIYPKASDFPVKQGDIIGKVGNTGSSGGPHLHMEIRTDGGNLPTNYLKNGVYKVTDNLPPVINRVAFFAFEDSTGFVQSRKLATVRPGHSSVIIVGEKFYVGVDAIDKMDGTPNKLAVERYQAFLDGEEFFNVEIGETSYAHQRYINSMIAYGERGLDMVKTYVEPGNLLSSKYKAVNAGIVRLSDDNIHTLEVRATDIYGNMQRASFKVRRDKSVIAYNISDTLDRKKLLWYAPNILNNEEIVYSIPNGALYSSTEISFGKIADAIPRKGVYSSVWRVADERLALHKNGTLKIKDSAIVKCDSTLRKRMLIAQFNPVDSSIRAVSGGYKDGGVVAKVSGGVYCVAIDTIAPTARLLLKDGRTAPGNGTIPIVVKDNFSGIADFVLEVDGQWTLGMIKGGRLRVYLNEDIHGRGAHKIKLTLIDGCDNRRTYNYNIVW